MVSVVVLYATLQRNKQTTTTQAQTTGGNCPGGIYLLHSSLACPAGYEKPAVETPTGIGFLWHFFFNNDQSQSQCCYPSVGKDSGITTPESTSISCTNPTPRIIADSSCSPSCDFAIKPMLQPSATGQSELVVGVSSDQNGTVAFNDGLNTSDMLGNPSAVEYNSTRADATYIYQNPQTQQTISFACQGVLRTTTCTKTIELLCPDPSTEPIPTEEDKPTSPPEEPSPTTPDSPVVPTDEPIKCVAPEFEVDTIINNCPYCVSP